MPMVKIGKNHFNSERIVNVITPATQGDQKNGVKVVLAGSEDLWLFGEEAETLRQWLASQTETSAPATLITKSEPQPAKPTPRR